MTSIKTSWQLSFSQPIARQSTRIKNLKGGFSANITRGCHAYNGKRVSTLKFASGTELGRNRGGPDEELLKVHRQGWWAGLRKFLGAELESRWLCRTLVIESAKAKDCGSRHRYEWIPHRLGKQFESGPGIDRKELLPQESGSTKLPLPNNVTRPRKRKSYNDGSWIGVSQEVKSGIFIFFGKCIWLPRSLMQLPPATSKQGPSN